MARGKKASAPPTVEQASKIKLLTPPHKFFGELLRLPQAATLAGMTVQGMRKAVNQGLIGVYRIDDVYFVSRQDALSYQPDSDRGRPRSKQ